MKYAKTTSINKVSILKRRNIPNMNAHFFHRIELEKIMISIIGKTLGEVDKRKVFERFKNKKKVTGIAGNVIEQSVLGYDANNDNTPDLNIDGTLTELKCTGLKPCKNNSKKLEAKEPMSITGVSPENIIHEEFFSSHFYNKIAHMLWVYYVYNSDTTVPPYDYRFFPIIGYEFFEPSKEDLAVLQQDWLLVRDFIIKLHKLSDPQSSYPEISHLRDKMMYLDTAPKWPHNPRFRFKRSYVDAIIQKNSFIQSDITSVSQIDQICHKFTEKYQNLSLFEISSLLDITFKGKSSVEQVMTRALGFNALKLSNIDCFAKAGIIPKTVVTTQNGSKTEDMKLMRIGFDEIKNTSISFEESSFYEYFTNHQLLCIIFKEPFKNCEYGENIFCGFKRLSFQDKFIYSKVYKVWEHTQKLIVNNKLKDIPQINKSGQQIINKTGIPSSAPNFMKSSTNEVFIRGDSSNSSNKPENVNGIAMYNQYLWIHGKAIVTALSSLPYL